MSIHNNALPDGVNPFLNNGTSVLYYHPQSRELAEAVTFEGKYFRHDIAYREIERGSLPR